MALKCVNIDKVIEKLDKANLELWAGTNDRTRTEFLDKLIVIITQLSLK